MVGVDTNPKALGFYMDGLLDHSQLIPRADDENYWKILNEIIANESVDLTFVQPEKEVIAWGNYFQKNGSFISPALIPPVQYAETLINKAAMADLLLELLSEEIPARMQTRGEEDLRKLVCDGLSEADFTFGEAYTHSTPRRLALAVVLNLVLDPLLILGWGPFPALGIRGAAAATLVTRGAACAVGFALLARRGLIARARPRWAALREQGSIGLPVAASGVVFSLVYVVLTRFTSEFGTSALAALGVGHKVESLSYMVCLGFGVAAATSVGQNLGAGSPDRARRSGETATVFATAAGALVAALFLVWPEGVMEVFTDDPGVVRDGASYLRIVAVAQLFMAADLVLESAMSGAGYTLLPMAASVLLTVARLPLAVGLAAVMGLAGIWWAISGTAVARGVAMAWIWRRGRWRRRAV